jgi:hypothetical protein
MKTLSLLYFFLSLSASAALKENFNISDQQYSLRVKPYLQSLSNDFYELFLNFRPDLASFKDLSRNNIKIKKELKYMEKICKKNVFQVCQASLKNLAELSLANHHLAQGLKAKGVCHKNSAKKCIFALKIVNDLYLVTLKSKLGLSIATLSQSPKITWVEIEKDLGQMNALTQSLITQSFPDENDQDFQLIWGTFFKDVENLFLVSNDAKLFQNWVDRLNFSINEFLLSLSNKEKNLPPGLKLKAETMHGKWNIMLREYL